MNLQNKALSQFTSFGCKNCQPYNIICIKEMTNMRFTCFSLSLNGGDELTVSKLIQFWNVGFLQTCTSCNYPGGSRMLRRKACFGR